MAPMPPQWVVQEFYESSVIFLLHFLQISFIEIRRFLSCFVFLLTMIFFILPICKPSHLGSNRGHRWCQLSTTASTSLLSPSSILDPKLTNKKIESMFPQYQLVIEIPFRIPIESPRQFTIIPAGVFFLANKRREQEYLQWQGTLQFYEMDVL